MAATPTPTTIDWIEWHSIPTVCSGARCAASIAKLVEAAPCKDVALAFDSCKIAGTVIE